MHLFIHISIQLCIRQYGNIDNACVAYAYVYDCRGDRKNRFDFSVFRFLFAYGQHYCCTLVYYYMCCFFYVFLALALLIVILVVVVFSLWCNNK